MRGWKDVYWPVALFMVINPIAALLGTIWFVGQDEVPLGYWVFTVVFAGATNLSITAGYHRLFAHRSYNTRPLVEWIYLLIGASAFQGSALKWSSDHRVHHTRVDTNDDPYSIAKGFWYAHMGWLFWKDSVDRPIHAPDLTRNLRVAFQDRWFIPLGSLMGFLLPATVSWIFCDSFWMGLFVGGALRIFLTQQSTFFVNSLCHTLGNKPYANEISARDSWIVAILTHGEGYHNFHHRFQSDYRNAIRWYQWDPTKWVILTLRGLGLAEKLRTVPAGEILRARMQVESSKLKEIGLPADRVEALREQVLQAQQRWIRLKAEYAEKKAQLKSDYALAKEEASQKLADFRREMAEARAEFHRNLELWQMSLRMGTLAG